MRPIDADELIRFIDRLYNEAAALNDEKAMGELAMAGEMVKMQQTIDIKLINEKYAGLDMESRKAFDQLLDGMYKETQKRNKQ